MIAFAFFLDSFAFQPYLFIIFKVQYFKVSAIVHCPIWSGVWYI